MQKFHANERCSHLQHGQRGPILNLPFRHPLPNFNGSVGDDRAIFSPHISCRHPCRTHGTRQCGLDYVLYKVHMAVMGSGNAQRIELIFYQTEAENVPVRDWLLGLSESNRREIGQDMQRVQFRWPVGMPLVRPMGKGLFEVRTSLPDGTIARVLFCFHQGELYALHGFIKKSQKAPATDLELARKRQKEVENG